MIDSARIGGSSPSFLHGLSLIGQYFNQQRARQITIAEVDTGFLVHYFPDGDWRKPRSLAVQHADLLELSGPFKGGSSGGRKGVLIKGGDTRDKRHPLFPMGYDLFFRLLGYKLDRRKATGLTICEAHDKIYVNYWLDKATFVIRDQRRQAVSSVMAETFDAKGIQKLIVHTQEGLASEALRYDQGMKMNPHDHISTLAMAFMLENDGNYRDTEALLSRIIAQVQEHPEAHYHLARLLISRGDKRGALAAIRRAIAIRDDLAPVHDLYGRILMQLNKPKDAVAAFEQAVSIDPEHGIYHFHLARVYEAVGRKEEAQAEMALAATEHAAPAWDMVQEEMSAEAPAAAARLADLAGKLQEESPAVTALLPPLLDTPAASALLPQLPKEEVPAAPMEAPVFQADWGATVARAERQEAEVLPPQAGAVAPPSLTPFEHAASGGPTGWPLGAVPAGWQQAAAPPPEMQSAPAAQAAPPADTPAWPPQPAPTWPQAPADHAPQPAAAYGWPQGAAQAGWQQAVAPPPETQPVPAPQAAPSAGAPAWPPQPAPGWAPQPASAASVQAGAASVLTSLPSATPPASAPPGWPQAQPAQAPTDWSGSLPSESPLLRQAAVQPQGPPLEQRLPVTEPATAPLQGYVEMPAAETGSPSSATGLQTTGNPPTGAPQEPAGQGGAETAGGANAVEIAAEIMMIQRALEAEPNRADLHRKLGFLLARQGKTAEAATEFRKALQCSRTSL